MRDDDGQIKLMAVGSPIFVWHSIQVWPLAEPSPFGLERDFALVEIDGGFLGKVVSTTALVGGPCGVQATNPGLRSPVEHVGHGTVVGTGGTARVGTLHTWDSSSGRFRLQSLASGGDSGSPAQTNPSHLAVGVITLAAAPTSPSGELLTPTLDLLAERMPGWELMGGTTGC